MTEIPFDGCEKTGECLWRDPAGVRYYLWGDSPSDLTVVIKIVHADDFEGRPINALGIGMERGREAVLAKIKQFLPDIQLNCDPANVSGNVGSDACGAFVDPGWVEVGFDGDGQLETIRFDGYHFI